jgi:hypothetical protein
MQPSLQMGNSEADYKKGLSHIPAPLLGSPMSTKSQRRFVIKEETIDETGECAFFVEYVASGDRVRVDIKDLADPFYLNSLGEIDW